MNKIEIRLSSPEETQDFIKICNTFISSINVYDGHIAIDAKSIVGMFSVADKKAIKVEMISVDENEIKRFLNQIKKYEVSK